MRTIVFLAVLLVAACRPAAVSSTPLPGATSPGGAVESFLRAVREGDLQAMGSVWGDKRGSARAHMAREELDRRVYLMQCYLNHQQTRTLSGPTSRGDTVLFAVELRNGDKRATTNFHTLEGPNARWFVQYVEPLPPFCNQAAPPPP